MNNLTEKVSIFHTNHSAYLQIRYTTNGRDHGWWLPLLILVYVLVNILLLLFVSFIPTTSSISPIYVNAIKMGASINCIAITIVMMPVGG